MNQFTEKDLAYISDMFSWNQEALKLANHFMNEANDEEVVEMLESTVEMHYDNLNILLSLLTGETKETEESPEEYEDYEEEEEEEDA